MADFLALTSTTDLEISKEIVVQSNAATLQTKTVTPSASQQVVSADSGYDGLSSVTVSGDSDLTAGNIKKGVNIFGVTGTYATPTQSKTLTLGSNTPATVSPDSGYALSQVSPQIDTSVIKAENIAEGVTMLGITGTHSGGGSTPKGALCFTANTAGSTIGMSITGSLPNLNLQYSSDEETWQTFTPGTTVITLTNAGDKVYFRGSNGWVSTDTGSYAKFTMSGSIAASGNIQSLLDPTLQATWAGQYCYCCLFQYCTSLTTAPALPATTLASNCYYQMFQGCTSLTTAPALPATTLASACYKYMFQGCTSLTTAPALPATTLASNCYYSMFNGCTSLTTAPALPATTLASNCYYQMFQGCTSLTTAPALPATTLNDSSYSKMFYGCTSLYVSDTSVSGTCEQAWTIPSSGTFTNTYSQSNMFDFCKGTRSSNDMPGASGNSYTYYTQNTPVSA